MLKSLNACVNVYDSDKSAFSGSNTAVRCLNSQKWLQYKQRRNFQNENVYTRSDLIFAFLTFILCFGMGIIMKQLWNSSSPQSLIWVQAHFMFSHRPWLPKQKMRPQKAKWIWRSLPVRKLNYLYPTQPHHNKPLTLNSALIMQIQIHKQFKLLRRAYLDPDSLFYWK